MLLDLQKITALKMKEQITYKLVDHYGTSIAITLPYSQMKVAMSKHMVMLKFNGLVLILM